jgi:hypothetical protein
MLYVFGFDRLGVAVGDLYFVDPAPTTVPLSMPRSATPLPTHAPPELY